MRAEAVWLSPAKRKGAAPRARPSSVSAAIAASPAPLLARRAWISTPCGVTLAAISARAVRAGSRAVTGPRRCNCPAKACAPGSSRPSLIQTMRSNPPLTRARRAAASARSGRHGFGSSRAMRALASAAVSASPGSRARVSGAVKSRNTGTCARSAAAAAAKAAARVWLQNGAEVQPSSMTISVRPPGGPEAALGAKLGRAKARIIKAAANARKITSHKGARSRLCSSVRRPSNRRVGGNSVRCGGGGLIRSSHHKAGSASNAASASGLANKSGPVVTYGDPRAAPKAAPARARRHDRCDARSWENPRPRRARG